MSVFRAAPRTLSSLTLFGNRTEQSANARISQIKTWLRSKHTSAAITCELAPTDCYQPQESGPHRKRPDCQPTTSYQSTNSTTAHQFKPSFHSARSSRSHLGAICHHNHQIYTSGSSGLDQHGRIVSWVPSLAATVCFELQSTGFHRP